MIGNENYNQNYGQSSGYAVGEAFKNALTTNVMTLSFAFMFLALLVTANTALVVSHSESMIRTIFTGGGLLAIVIAEFAIVIAAGVAMKKNNVTLSAILFFGYAVVNGLLFSSIFLVYEIGSIVTVFFTTAGLFAALAIVGYTTKKDLTNMGTLCIFGLLAIIIGSLVNFFIGSSTLEMIITAAGIAIFLGLIAYDTQKIKNMALNNSGYAPMVLGLWGAMQLYLDFINLFLRLLSIMGKRK